MAQGSAAVVKSFKVETSLYDSTQIICVPENRLYILAKGLSSKRRSLNLLQCLICLFDLVVDYLFKWRSTQR